MPGDVGARPARRPGLSPRVDSHTRCACNRLRRLAASDLVEGGREGEDADHAGSTGRLLAFGRRGGSRDGVAGLPRPEPVQADRADAWPGASDSGGAVLRPGALPLPDAVATVAAVVAARRSALLAVASGPAAAGGRGRAGAAPARVAAGWPRAGRCAPRCRCGWRSA